MSLQPHPDWGLIEKLGGPSKVAELLGFRESGRVQRVQNWKTRGIPAHVKVQRPDLFLGPAVGSAPDAAANAAGG